MYLQYLVPCIFIVDDTRPGVSLRDHFYVRCVVDHAGDHALNVPEPSAMT